MTSLACKTGAPIGDGGAITGPGRLLGDSCTRICTVTTTDTDGTGYGFEFGASCRHPGHGRGDEGARLPGRRARADRAADHA